MVLHLTVQFYPARFAEIAPVEWGIIAGVFQVLGYAAYIRKSLAHEVEPNPATWFMFSYGTAILAVLEAESEASIPVLILPVICALSSMAVSFLCWRRGAIAWPQAWADRGAFVADVSLTVAYVGAWWLARRGDIGPETKDAAVWVFLIAANLTTVTAFSPLIRGAYAEPEREHPLPWTLWTIAYTALATATWYESGPFSILMAYPASNALLHGCVAWIARPRLLHRIRLPRSQAASP